MSKVIFWLQSANGRRRFALVWIINKRAAYFLIRRSAASTLQKSAGKSWLYFTCTR